MIEMYISADELRSYNLIDYPGPRGFSSFREAPNTNREAAGEKENLWLPWT